MASVERSVGHAALEEEDEWLQTSTTLTSDKTTIVWLAAALDSKCVLQWVICQYAKCTRHESPAMHRDEQLLHGKTHDHLHFMSAHSQRNTQANYNFPMPVPRLLFSHHSLLQRENNGFFLIAITGCCRRRRSRSVGRMNSTKPTGLERMAKLRI